MELEQPQVTPETPSEAPTSQEQTPVETPQEPVQEVITPTETPEAEIEIPLPESMKPQVQEPVLPQADPLEGLTVDQIKGRFDKKALLQAAGVDEYLSKAIEYYEATGDLTPYLEVMSVDYTKLSDSEIMERALKEQYASQNLSKEEMALLIQDELATRFKQDNEQYSEREVQLGGIRLKVEADKVRKELIEKQAQFKAPERVVTEPTPTAAPPTPQEVFQRLAKVPEVQSFYRTKKIAFGDPQSPYNYEVEEPGKYLQMLSDAEFYQTSVAVKDENGQAKRNEDGTVKLDMNRLLRAAAFLDNEEKIVQGLIAHGRTLGKKEVVEEAENVSNPQDHSSTGDKGDFWSAFHQRLRESQ